jgi:hypothetical protein
LTGSFNHLATTKTVLARRLLEYAAKSGQTEMSQKRIILGKDRREAEAARDRWLSEHPDIKILNEHPPRPEPRTLLVWIGGRDVPRVSIEIQYEHRKAS